MKSNGAGFAATNFIRVGAARLPASLATTLRKTLDWNGRALSADPEHEVLRRLGVVARVDPSLTHHILLRSLVLTSVLLMQLIEDVFEVFSDAS